MAKTRFNLLCAGALLTMASWQTAPGAKPGALTEPGTPHEIERLVSELGDALYENRMYATRRLCAIGLPARHRLKAAASSESPEVALRARHLLSLFETLVFHHVAVELGSKGYVSANVSLGGRLGGSVAGIAVHTLSDDGDFAGAAYSARPGDRRSRTPSRGWPTASG